MDEVIHNLKVFAEHIRDVANDVYECGSVIWENYGKPFTGSAIKSDARDLKWIANNILRVAEMLEEGKSYDVEDDELKIEPKGKASGQRVIKRGGE